MTNILLSNARVFDGTNADCPEDQHVLVRDGLISEISDKPIKASDAQVVDVGGRTLMPGMIDAHIHAYASDVDFQRVGSAGEPYRTAHAARMLGHALDCGFTTLRDIGGGDWSLWRALEDKLIRGPRFFYAGKVLSMTGGHGDFRQASESHHSHGYCSCAGNSNFAAVIADGVDECLKAVREELRRGAHCIKIMGSGGVASPTDPIWMNQYREDEVRAIVNETTERRTYTSAHCHPTSAIRRSVEFGVRCIEHGTLIDDETARFVAERGAYIIPTMVIIFALIELGKQLGFPPQSQKKAEEAYSAALVGMDLMRKAGVKIGFGTDLLGKTYVRQCREFTIRSEVFSPVEILRQCTSMNAEIMQLSGQIGCVKPGAFADLLVVDGDPLKDISLLAADGQNLSLIVRGGEIVKNRLS
jgi:imidazolonepropionase-like amidohydrolase